MTEYRWEPHHVQELGVAGAFRLRGAQAHGPYYIPSIFGFLKKGGRKHPGWFVHWDFAGEPLARLPHTLDEDEAMNTAKMLILLSLKDLP